jgi:hypothetical protein
VTSNPGSMSTALFTLLDANNNVIGVSNTPPNPASGATGPQVNPFATIITNYRALAATQLTLSIVDATGAPSTLTSIESPVTVHTGEASVNAAIEITGNPLTGGVATTVTLTLHASIATAVGPISFAGSPVTFTLTGTTPRQIIT